MKHLLFLLLLISSLASAQTNTTYIRSRVTDSTSVNTPSGYGSLYYNEKASKWQYVENGEKKNLTQGSGVNLNFGTKFEDGFNPVITATVGDVEDVSFLAFRQDADRDTADGFSDVRIGVNSGNPNSPAGGNITVGNNVLPSLVRGGTWNSGTLSTNNGDRNIAIGSHIAPHWGSMVGGGYATKNTLIGFNVANENTPPFSNTVAIGTNAAWGITGIGLFDQGVIIGNQAGMQATYNRSHSVTNDDITMIGPNAGRITTFDGGFGSILLGRNAGIQASFIEAYNILIGGAGGSASLGRSNIGIGEAALASSVGGTPGGVGVGTNQFNVAIGTHTMEGSGPSEKSTFVGTEAGSGGVSGQRNVGFGNWALPRVNGNNNMGIGPYAGWMASSFPITGNGNSFIGPSTGVHTSSATVNNVMVIGNPTGTGSTGGYRPTVSSGNVYIGSTGSLVLTADYDGTPVTATLSSSGFDAPITRTIAGVDLKDDVTQTEIFSAILKPTASTGTDVAFDIPRTYGYSAAATGNITFSTTGFVEGTTQLMIHNDSSEPTFESGMAVISGEYLTGTNNYIFFYGVKSNLILVTISQEQ